MKKFQIAKKINETTELMLSTEPPRKKSRPARVIAFSGVFCALALVIMLLTSLLGLFTYAGPILAAAALIPVCEEFGRKTGLTAWAAIAVLGFILLPDREMALFFVCFGWYPAALRVFYRIRSKPLRIMAKAVIYLILIGLMYGVLCGLLGIDPELAENTKLMNTALLITGGLTFLLCDAAYCRLTLLWQLKWRKQFKRML